MHRAPTRAGCMPGFSTRAARLLLVPLLPRPRSCWCGAVAAAVCKKAAQLSPKRAPAAVRWCMGPRQGGAGCDTLTYTFDWPASCKAVSKTRPAGFSPCLMSTRIGCNAAVPHAALVRPGMGVVWRVARCHSRTELGASWLQHQMRLLTNSIAPETRFAGWCPIAASKPLSIPASEGLVLQGCEFATPTCVKWPTLLA